MTLQLNLQVVDDRLKVLENKLILDKLVKKQGGDALHCFVLPSPSVTFLNS